MRLISPHEKYSIQVFEAKERIVTDRAGYAQLITLDKPVVANFQKTGLLDHEVEAALMSFDFSGLADGVNPLTTVSVFDTEVFVQANFDEDERDAALIKMDARLRELHELFPSQYVIVEHPAAARPWPRYDDYGVEEILSFQEALGVAPETVRLYELEHEKRGEIIQAMLRLEDPDYVQPEPATEPQGSEINVSL